MSARYDDDGATSKPHAFVSCMGMALRVDQLITKQQETICEAYHTTSGLRRLGKPVWPAHLALGSSRKLSGKRCVS